MYARGCLFSSNLAILVRSSNLLVWTTGTFVNSLNTNKTGSISRPPWTTYIFFVVHSTTISTKSETCQVGNLKKLVILLLHFFLQTSSVWVSVLYIPGLRILSWEFAVHDVLEPSTSFDFQDQYQFSIELKVLKLLFVISLSFCVSNLYSIRIQPPKELV
jgi:hypothetical protein